MISLQNDSPQDRQVTQGSIDAKAHRIAFVIPNLSGGGAARVATILTQEWARMGHEVHLITFEDTGATSAYPVADAIIRHQIGLTRSPRNPAGFVLNNVQRIHRLRSTLKSIKPSAVISFLLDANVPTILAGTGLEAPVLVAERNHPAHDKVSALKSRIRAWTFPYANRLCVQTENVRDWYLANLSLDAVVIPNPAPERSRPPSPPGTAPKNGARYSAVALGRLEPQKGYDRLIDAFARIADQIPDWDLTIFGEGGERAQLAALAASHGLQDRIRLPGVTTDPEGALNQADLFVHSARFEGYPNAIIEALAAGLCVVATDCPGATGELLQGGTFGMLVPDAGAEQLAQALVQIMTNHESRCAYATRATDAIERLKPNAIAQRWLEEALVCKTR